MRFLLGGELHCDLEILAERKLLIQASPGGGKSRTIRRIAEQTHGKIQQIIIDPEGELVSLRERFDYVLAAANGGDTPAHPRSAALLAERLLELEASAILDLYELKPAQRVDFVKRFFETLVDAPKRLWHPVLVFLDEAQMFAPEGAKCESTAAVIDQATRGRKRGQSLIVATQRLSLLDKNVAAALHNKLIGFTSLDTDLKRAAFELGFDKEKMLGLRDLAPMHFWAFGPAIVRAPTLVEIGPHVTSHPKSGARLTAPTPPPTDRIRALLPKLADLPAEAEQRARSLQDLQRENVELKRRLSTAERVAPARVETKIERVEVPILTDAQVRNLRATVMAAQEIFNDSAALAAQLTEARSDIAKTAQLIEGLITRALAPRPVQTSAKPAPAKSAPKSLPLERHNTVSGGDYQLTSAQQAILNAAGFLESLGILEPDVVQLALFAGLSASGGYWRASVGRVRTLGLLLGTRLTNAGRGLASPAAITSTEQLHAHVLEHLLEGAQRQILKVLIEAYPEELSIEECGSRAGITPTGGYWRASIGRLRSLGLVTKKGPLAALPVLFLEGAA